MGQRASVSVDGSEHPRLLMERLALNEAIERDLNSTEAEWLDDGDREPQQFRCECSRASCDESVWVDRAEWGRIRSDPYRFFVVAGHDDARVSRVVERTRRFWVVEKTQTDARAISERTDPIGHPLVREGRDGVTRST